MEEKGGGKSLRLRISSPSWNFFNAVASLVSCRKRIQKPYKEQQILTPKSANTFLTFRHEIVVKFPSFFLGTFVEALRPPLFCPHPTSERQKDGDSGCGGLSLSSPSLFFASFLFMRETSLRHFSFFLFPLPSCWREEEKKICRKETAAKQKKTTWGKKRAESICPRGEGKKGSNFSAPKLECFFAGRKEGVQENGKVRCVFFFLRRNSLRVVLASLRFRIEATAAESERIRPKKPGLVFRTNGHKWASARRLRNRPLVPSPSSRDNKFGAQDRTGASVHTHPSVSLSRMQIGLFRNRGHRTTQQPLLQLDGAGLGLSRLLLRRQKIFFAFPPSFVVCRFLPPPGGLEEMEENSSSCSIPFLLPLLLLGNKKDSSPSCNCRHIFFRVSSKEDRKEKGENGRKLLISRLYTEAPRKKKEKRNNTGGGNLRLFPFASLCF